MSKQSMPELTETTPLGQAITSVIDYAIALARQHGVGNRSIGKLVEMRGRLMELDRKVADETQSIRDRNASLEEQLAAAKALVHETDSRRTPTIPVGPPIDPPEPVTPEPSPDTPTDPSPDNANVEPGPTVLPEPTPDKPDGA